MRKISVILIAFLAMVSVASALIGLNWEQDPDWVYYIYLEDGATFLPQNSIVQLIYSPTASMSIVDPSDPLVPQGSGEVVLQQDVANFAGSITYAGLTFADTYVGGYAYTRVFNATVAGDITNGCWYGQGGMSSQLEALPGSPTPADYEESFIADLADYDLALQVLVPEPGTMTFALIGLGAILIRRKMRK